MSRLPIRIARLNSAGPTRRACLAGLGAAALAPLVPAMTPATTPITMPGTAPAMASAVASGAGQGVFLAGGWVLTGADLARLGPAAPPAVRLA